MVVDAPTAVNADQRRTIVKGHLVPVFGDTSVADIDKGDFNRLDETLGAARRSPQTRRNTLGLRTRRVAALPGDRGTTYTQRAVQCDAPVTGRA